MTIRIEHGIERPAAVTITVDGRMVSAVPGESVAAALFAAGRRMLRTSTRADQPRGMFCMMGVCQECAILIDGRKSPACQEPVRAGMTVTLGTAS